ncbi:bestrophin-2-like [Eriocheir sinensis]|uniref:bestrophin-2-like n=1 Tax=Eriocheir sinensis TaxID=95602 RepID=UPI0021C9C1CC|nr:bestrophin-2-like [Eriocheir sinensis]
MTVTYTQKVSDCKGFGSFWRLLFRWRGSLYKLVWPDTCVYCVLYFLCSMVYRFGLDEAQRRIFEHVALYCDYFRNLIPISFVLGFYVSVVVQRWWEQYLSIPWPDSFALLCTAYIGGRGVRERSIRATLLRYVNLSCALTFAAISPRVSKKFPSYKELLEAGYLTPRELKVLQNQKGRSSAPLTTLPLMWGCKLVAGARACGYVTDDHGLRLLVDELTKLRDKAGMLVRWTDISIPLVYTQVATMAVYSFFFFSVVGRQFLDPGQQYVNRTIDFFVPIFTLLQFFFYMGWLKVAESLVNPFGEDDDDFELECILERHLKMSYLLGDVTPSDDPLFEDDEDDAQWHKVFPGAFPLPTEDLAFLTHKNRRGGGVGNGGEAGGGLDACSSGIRRQESDLETAILCPEETDLPDTARRHSTTTTTGYGSPRLHHHPRYRSGHQPHHHHRHQQQHSTSTPTTPTGSNINLCPSPSSATAGPTITTTNPTPPHSPREVDAPRDTEMHHHPASTAPPTTTSNTTASTTLPDHTAPPGYTPTPSHPAPPTYTPASTQGHTPPPYPPTSIPDHTIPANQGHSTPPSHTPPAYTPNPSHPLDQCVQRRVSHPTPPSERFKIPLEGIVNPMYME